MGLGGGQIFVRNFDAPGRPRHVQRQARSTSGQRLNRPCALDGPNNRRGWLRHQHAVWSFYGKDPNLYFSREAERRSRHCRGDRAAGASRREGHGHWHQEREELIKASGLAWTFLRPTMFMSTALQWAPTIKADRTVYFPGGTSKFAPIDPRDVSALACSVLLSSEHEGQGYELTGPELLSGQCCRVNSGRN